MINKLGHCELNSNKIMSISRVSKRPNTSKIINN